MGDERWSPPGWYKHADTPDALRYYDGKAWTERTKPLPPPTPERSGPGVFTIARGVALGITAVLAGLFFLAECEKSSAEDEYLDCLLSDTPRYCEDPSPNN